MVSNILVSLDNTLIFEIRELQISYLGINKFCKKFDDLFKFSFFYEIESNEVYFYWHQKFYDKNSGRLKVWDFYNRYFKLEFPKLFKIEFDYQRNNGFIDFYNLEDYLIKVFVKLKYYSKIFNKKYYLYSLANFYLNNSYNKYKNYQLYILWNNGNIGFGNFIYELDYLTDYFNSLGLPTFLDF